MLIFLTLKQKEKRQAVDIRTRAIECGRTRSYTTHIQPPTLRYSDAGFNRIRPQKWSNFHVLEHLFLLESDAVSLG